MTEQLSSVIANIRDRIDNGSPPSEGFTSYLSSLKEDKWQTKIAGQTADYVNTVLKSCTEGTASDIESDTAG